MKSKYQVKETIYFNREHFKGRRFIVVDENGMDVFGEHFTFREAQKEAKRLLIDEHIGDILTYHRPPTPYEMKFGHGATHYKDFGPAQFIRKDGAIKKRLKCPIDGLIYTY